MTSTSLTAADPAATPTGPRLVPTALAATGTAAVAVGSLAILVLHVVPPTSATSPWRRTISEYALSSLGGVFDVGVLSIAIGSLLITASLWTTHTLRPASTGSVALLAWSVGMVLLVIFPKHDWSVGPSTHGSIHRVASLVAFVSVPVAAWTVGRSRSARLAAPARTMLIAGLVSAGWLAVLIGAFLIGPFTGTAWWLVLPLGAMERGIAFFAVAAVLASGWLAVRSSRPPLPAAGADPDPGGPGPAAGRAAQSPKTVRRR